MVLAARAIAVLLIALAIGVTAPDPNAFGRGLRHGSAGQPSAAFRKLLAGTVDAPAPAPAPETDVPLAQSPVISPFIPSNDTAPPGSDQVCCCRTPTAVYEEPYTQPTPSGCCCGSRSDCCSSGGLVNVICGGGHVCGILMLLSALIAMLVLSVCITGTFISRRRRAAALAAAHGGTVAPQRRPSMPVVTIPEDQIEALMVRPATAAAAAAAVEGSEADAEAGPENKECPICLDGVDVTPDRWAVFPCSHGCCRPCLNDLLRHSSRRINPTTMALLCPLCRKVAVAPRPPPAMETDEGAPQAPLVPAPSPPPPTSPVVPTPEATPEEATPEEAAPAAAEGGIWRR